MSTEKKKVIHAPLEIAGQVGLLCEFLRKAGYHATGYNYYTTYLNYQKIMNVDVFELMKIIEPAIEFYDLFHFHNGYTFIDDYRDIEMIGSKGKKMIMHHRGNDVRARTLAARGAGYVNPYVNADCSLPDEQIHENLLRFSKTMSAAIVQDFELYYYVIDYYRAHGKNVYVLPRLIDTSVVLPVYTAERKEPPLVIHAPTNRDFKGSAIIDAVIERLQTEIPLRYKRIEQMSHEEALQLYKKADIVIDQILCGAYGNLSVEAMALGKPVICYIRPDLVSLYPKDLPIVSANPETLYYVLKELAQDKEHRIHLGRQGRKFVEAHHEASRVIQQLLKIYETVLSQ
ncbi:glycosyltransferase [Aneurinibacillus tyrosinisolvens]|uniref:glycosyltransferase n=1 Tax=Aneurinibacillus tyrosinisolvens TaxID=1443435 RepID=UPI00063F542D|nr:glycosyltransferase [Aneurinibacillus tyrosinisolvens]